MGPVERRQIFISEATVASALSDYSPRYRRGNPGGGNTEAFYMIDKSRARTMGGAGLGLTLCREIAGIHGSELEIESRQGEGTSICVCLTVEGEKK